jgi:hypothetical protein
MEIPSPVTTRNKEEARIRTKVQFLQAGSAAFPADFQAGN